MKKVLIITMFSVLFFSVILFIYIQNSETTTFAQSSTNTDANCQTKNLNQSNTSSNFENKRCDFSRYNTLRTRSLNATSLPKPKYPKNLNISGCVSVKILVDKQGNVFESCSLTKKESNKSCKNITDNPTLKQAAEEAARNSKFDLRSWSLNGRDFFEMIINYNFVAPGK